MKEKKTANKKIVGEDGLKKVGTLVGQMCASAYEEVRDLTLSDILLLLRDDEECGTGLGYHQEKQIFSVLDKVDKLVSKMPVHSYDAVRALSLGDILFFVREGVLPAHAGKKSSGDGRPAAVAAETLDSAVFRYMVGKQDTEEEDSGVGVREIAEKIQARRPSVARSLSRLRDDNKVFCRGNTRAARYFISDT